MTMDGNRDTLKDAVDALIAAVRSMNALSRECHEAKDIARLLTEQLRAEEARVDDLKAALNAELEKLV